MSFQPWVGTADAENLVFLSRGANYTGGPVDVNEAERVALDQAEGAVAGGEFAGAASIIAILDLLARRERGILAI